MLADVRPTQQSEFRTLSNELDELRRDPVGNKAAICAAEEKLCAVVTRLAEESLAATAAIREEHPFLPRRVLGVPLSELPLRDDAAMRELARRRSAQLSASPGPGDAKAAEDAMLQRAEELARTVMAAKREREDANELVRAQNPFLVYDDRKCVPLAVIPLSSDNAYQELYGGHLSALEDAEANAPRLAELEEALRARADELALAACASAALLDECPFLGLSDAAKVGEELLKDAEFQQLRARREELLRDPVKNVEALREIERAMNARGEAVAQRLRAEEGGDDEELCEEEAKEASARGARSSPRSPACPEAAGDHTVLYPFLPDVVDGVAQDELCLDGDPYFLELLTRYRELVPGDGAPSLPLEKQLYERLLRRAGQLAADTKKARAAEERAAAHASSTYPYLEPWSMGVPLSALPVEEDAAFCEMALKREKELAKAPGDVNQDLVREMDAALQERARSIAQVLCAEEEALRAAHPFLGSTVRGVPLRELCLKADPEFARLSAQYVQSASSCDADARADQERALREAADRVARDVRAAKRLRGARAEDLRERYAFLPEEPARGIMLADVRPTQQSEFRTLSNELDELRRDPVGNKAAICAAEEKLCAVVTRLAEESLAATAAIREEHPFLPRRVLGVPLSELPLRDDAAMRELARRRSAQLSASPGPGDAKAAEDAMLQRAEELARTVMAAKREREDANELVRAQNPFLVYDDRKCVPLAVIPLSSDNAYQELYGGHLSALEDAEANAPRLAELEEALRARADELALAACASAALLDECPFLGLSDAAKVGEELLKDAEFQQLRARREELLRDPVKNVEALREIERAMNARGEAVAQRLRAEEGGDDEELCEEEAKEASARGARSSPRSPACPEAAGDHTVLYPFLPDVVDGVAQDELCLDGDPYFLELLTRYRELVPGDGAPSLPLEKQLYERLLRRAGQLAADTKKARAAEERAAAHASSTYPYLEPWSMGVPLSALPVEEDAAFCEMALKREKELAKAPGDVNQDLVREMDAALQERARSIAQVLCAEEEALRAAHPFLGSTVRGVPLRELCLKADPEFARLSAQYVQSASSCDADARADQERALREAADRVARDVRAAKRLRGARAEDLRERYAFLPEEPARGIMLADVRPTQQSEFRTLSNELDELRRDPVGNKAAICAAEEKLCAVVTRLAEESLAATAAIREEHPFLPRRVLGVPLSELPLRDDAAMRELARRRSAQLSASPGPGDAKAAEDAMLQRAEELARTVMAAKREREDANELVRAQNPFLVYDDRKCVPLAVIPLSSDNAYQELYGGHLSALEDAEANAPRLAELEEALRARADELALAACASAALLDECPFLGLSDAAKVGEELLKDAEFQQLRARREELLRDPVKNVEALREIERAMNARGEAVAQRLRAEEGGDDEELCEEEAKEASARGARSSPRSPACPEAAGDHTVLYPFLPDVVDGVAQDELCLDGDPYFLELLTRYRELVPGDGAPSLPLEKQLYERLLRRAGQLAADTKKARAAEERAAAHASSTYPYLEPWSMGVPLSALPVEEDAAFCEMALKREKELAKAPGDVNQDLVREMDAALQERARSIAQVLCAEEEALRAAHPFLGSTVRGVPLRELCLKADPEFARLSAQYVQSASSCDADARADQERALREAADRVARDVRAAKRLRGARAEDLRERYAFLPEEPARGIMLADVRPTQQSEFRTLSNELDELRRDPVGNKAAICAAEEKLCAVVTRLAEESLAATAAIREEHPFLPRRVLGVPLSELPLRDDAAMRELARRRSAQLSASPGPGDAKAAEDAMLQRAEELARTVMAAKREREDANELVRAQNPFLVYDDRKCVPLAVIPLSSDNAYQELYGGHLSALEDAEANAPRLAELEEALRARADELALAACASAALLDECPFLGLSDAAKVGEELLKDAEFQQLRARREELLRDPVKNVEALREIERAMNARGEAVAQRLRAEEGGDDEELCEEEAKEASARGARSSPRSPACPEAAGDHTVLYPFLPDVVDGVAQDELCLDGDPYFLELLTRYRELVPGDGAPSLPLEKQLYERLLRRAGQLAADTKKARAAEERAAAHASSTYPYLEPWSMGVPLSALPVEEDAAFCEMALKREKELAKAPGDVNQDLVREMDAALQERARSIAQVLCAEEEALRAAHPFLGSTVRGVPLRELCLKADPEFARLSAQYVQSASSCDADARADQERALREAADRVARDVRAAKRLRGARAEDLRERYAFLPEEPARGIMLADVRPTQQSEFRTLSNELDELRRDPVGNKAAICAAEEKLCAVVTRLAEESLAATAAIREEHPFLPRRVLGVPLSELPLRDDAAMRELARRRSAQLSASPGPGDAKAAEDAMLQRAEELARTVMAAKREREDANELVRAQNPFLVYDDRKCVPLAVIPLSSDNAYQELYGGHLSALEDAEANAPRLAELEEALRARADELALAACASAALLDECPFLGLSDAAKVGEELLKDAEFQQLRARREELLRDPVKNVEALREIERAMNARGEAVAQRLRAEEGGDDEELCEEEAKEASARGARSSPRSPACPEAAGDHTVLYPFLPDVVDGVAQDELCLDGDPYFLELLTRYRELVPGDGAPSLPLEKQLYERLLRRAGQLAADTKKARAAEERAAAHASSTYPYLEPWSMGVPLSALPVEEDAAFCEMALKREKELAKAPGDVNQDLVREMDAALQERARSIAQVLCAEEEALRAAHPFLGSTVRGVPLRELCLKADPEFARLSAQYVQSASSCDADARADQERALREAADRVARDVRAAKRLRGARAEDLRERYAFLPEEPARGIMLADVRPTQQSEFRTLSNELDELRRDPVGNKAAICAAEEKLCAVVTRLAEESLAATAAIREEHPFLPRRVLGVPLSELPLRDDAAMRELARRRSAQLSASPGPGDAKAAEDAMLQRAEELARTVMAAKREREDANELVRAQNPFLVYDDRKCVPLAVIPLSSDNAYQELYGGHLSALEDAEANAPRLAELEEALRARADELALAACASAALLDECPFLGLSDAAKVGEELLKDAEFQQLRARREELLRDPVKNVEALREIERAMNARGEAVAQRLRAEEGGDDEELCEEEAKEASARGARSSPRSPACPEAAGDHTVLYPFLPDVVDGVAQDELCLDGDPYFLELLTRYRELVPGDGAPSLPLEKQLYERLLRRAGQLAADTKKARAAEERAAAHASSTYPYLEPWSMGVPLSALPVEEDAAFCEMALKREKELAKAPGDVNQDLVREMDAALQERARSIAQVLCAEEEALRAAHPFLGSTVRGVPLRELCLKADPEFARLSAQYVQSASSCDADARADQERALREAADRVARDVRAAKRLRGARAEDLRERYAFLPEEPARGIMLADVRPTQQSEFRTLSNELDELRRDPVGNKAAICAAEEKLCAVVTRLAEESLAATAAIREEHPFLPRRVLGVPLSELPLRDDAAMRELARRRSAQLSASPGPGDAKAAEDAMLQRAEELARTVMAAKREREDANELVRAQNPFLVYDDRKCVPLAVIPLSSDNAYQELYGGHLSALEDAEANAPRLAELEEALRARADELALAACASAALLDECPFLGLSDAAKVGEELLKDAEFQQLRARREELLRDPVKNVEALREIERAMNARGEAVAQRLRAEEGGDDEELCEEEAKEASARGARSSPRSPACPEAAGDHTVLYPFLPDVVDGVAQDELCLDGDPYFLELLTRYRELVPGDGAPSLPLEKQLYERLLRRAGQLAADTKKARAAEERAAAHASSTYPYLEPWSMGVPLSALPVEEDAAFCEMALKREKELAKAPGDVNQDLVREMDAALQERARSIAQVLCAEEEALRAAHPFLGSTVRGVPLRELCLKADPEFARLSAQYVQSASSCDADARADQERALREAADRVARDVRAAKRLRGARAEDLRERYAFLPEEPARGIMLADVRPTQQSEFRTLSNELDELRRDPVGNKAAICAAEEKLCAVVTRLAEESLAATAAIREEHPFLPRRVLGVPLSELPLSDDSSFCRSLRRRLRSVKYSSNRRDVLSAEKEMLQRAEELARTVMAAKREREDANELVRAQNPFLVYDDRKCVPLAVIPLSSDNAYQELYGGHLSALEDAEANAPRLAELEEALRARADELALFKHERDLFVEMFPFITYCNASDWRKELLKDAEFQQLRARREELLRDPVKNAKALREIERAMNARGEAVMRSLRGVDVSDESDAGELFAKNEYDELKEQFKDAYLSARRRSTAYALQGLTVEENVIEVCIESEVVSYNLGRSRNAAKERNRCRRRRGRRSVAKGDFTDDGSLVFDGSVPSSVGTHLIAGDKDNAASRVASPVFVQADGLDRAFDTQSKYADEDRSTPASPLPCDRSASLVDRDAKQSHSRCSPLSKCVSVRASPYDEMLAAARADGGDAVSGKSSPKDENLCNVDTVCAQPADVEVCSGDVGDDLPACVVDDVSDGDATVAKAAADAVDGTCNAQKSSKTLILNVCDLEEEMLDLLNLEALSRSRLSDEERYCRDHILLEGEDEEIVIENTRRFNEKLDLLVADEVGARFCVEEGREEEMCKMKAELSAMLKLQEKISDLLARESEARDIVLCCEKEDFGLIAQLWVTDYNAVLEGEEEREKLRTIEEEAQAREACAVIKSVVFAYRARRRLANRFLSRKVHERKNAIEDLHAAEHTARLAIMEEEGMDHARLLEARDSAAVHILRLGLKPLLELEKEEDNVRHQLIDDCMFDLNNLHRAARKIVARQKEQAPSLLQLLDFEKQDDALRNATSNTGSGENCGSPLPGPHGFCESDEDAEVGEELEENEEDYDNIVESGMYKGYTLDSIGAFLLQYERDLRRMRSFLEKNRNAMVAEHDLLKKSRDNATQDIVHASSGGSLWIPTRPLPLSDLVRGPSAQFRRGYIADARGQRPTLKTTDTDIRTLSSRNSMFVDTFRNTQQL
ncbi:hypothetical protein ERJ75_001221500 [Trypanosoma vivax]|nr:hypothetical protein ERJ75_001221500 [Trypanosoma vivax]